VEEGRGAGGMALPAVGIVPMGMGAGRAKAVKTGMGIT